MSDTSVKRLYAYSQDLREIQCDGYDVEVILVSDYDRVVSEYEAKLEGAGLLKHDGYSVIEDSYFQNLQAHIASQAQEIAKYKSAINEARSLLDEAIVEVESELATARAQITLLRKGLDEISKSEANVDVLTSQRFTAWAHWCRDHAKETLVEAAALSTDYEGTTP